MARDPGGQRLERGRLARRLRFLGFGMFQGGVWISPRDREREVGPILEELGIVEHCEILVGRTAGLAGRRHFGHHYPASGPFGVTHLVDDDALIELVAVAVIAEERTTL